jgi:nanoRNase/pAp phosphatase (c-di-AMP/oligoRNAs hydrolase)
MYVDVRPDVGATASLLFEYLKAAGLSPDTGLATAMFYAVQTDTRGLSRGESPVDRDAYFRLLEMLDRGQLNRIIQAGLPRDYFRAFSKGLYAAKIYGRTVVSYVGEVHRPDFPAEMADLLIRLEDARAVLCMGHHNSTMYLSLRTKSKGLDAGLLIQQVIVPPGKAGGHGMMAGGQVPLDGKNPKAIVNDIQGRFLKVMGELGGAESLLS